ncbi:MAG TPA: hypothetical protein VHS99_28090, partial [Chloroflexota bacterium]|nr:hypothetical protein [Chloroflexota bacterium]
AAHTRPGRGPHARSTRPGAPVLAEPLRTPADVYGCLIRTGAAAGQDATVRFSRRLEPGAIREQLQPWLAHTDRHEGRRFSIGSEVWGATAVHRRRLAELVGSAVGQAFPRWREVPAGGLRLYCKADTQTAILGVQLYSNLSQEDDGRPGALRDHLAFALLTLAGVRREDAVLDPCMGSGRILRAARRWPGVRACFGVEVDAGAYRLARQHLGPHGATLFNQGFETLDAGALPSRLKLVSNLPFGVQFSTVPTGHLLDFIARLGARLNGLALLMGRGQAAEVSRALGRRTRHVLVLGQPAAIVYSPRPVGHTSRPFAALEGQR